MARIENMAWCASMKRKILSTSPVRTRPRLFLGSPALREAAHSRVATAGALPAPSSSDRPLAAVVALGLRHPVPDRLRRWLELLRQRLRRSSLPDQRHQLPLELFGVSLVR